MKYRVITKFKNDETTEGTAIDWQDALEVLTAQAFLEDVYHDDVASFQIIPVED